MEERLEQVEVKLAYQEKLIKDLNDVVYEQQQTVDRLSAICDLLMSERKEGPAPGPANEKPPHY